ncbi:MAG TPA: ArsR family transcriptional regulator [Candidatus Thermoplasmatota archaeon]|nr:ArsR family transcriptional regulator [Candidatus Thermoplasmatota archaeon]
MDDERVVAALRALSSVARLRILRQLGSPRQPSEIRVDGARERRGLRLDRILSRPAVSQHLAVLEKAGLVARGPDGYVIHQQSVFALLVELGALARIHPVVEVDVALTRTRAPETLPASIPPRPRLVLVGAQDERGVYPLQGRGPWRVGRSGEVDVRLWHDPHVSREHLVLTLAGDRLRVHVSPHAKNPVLVDLASVPGGGEADLAPGAVLVVGGSALVFQP